MLLFVLRKPPPDEVRDPRPWPWRDGPGRLCHELAGSQPSCAGRLSGRGLPFGSCRRMAWV